MVQWSSTIRDSGKTTIKLKRMRGGRVGERAFHRDDEWLEAEIARRATLKSYDWAGRDAFPHGSNRGKEKQRKFENRSWKRISCVRGNEMRGMKKNNKIKNNNNSYRGSKGCKTILQLQRGTGMKILVRFTRKFTSWIYENLNLTYFAFLDEYSLGRIIDHWNIFLFVIHNFVSSRATVVKLHYRKEKKNVQREIYRNFKDFIPSKPLLHFITTNHSCFWIQNQRLL